MVSDFILFFYDTYCSNHPLIVASTKAFKLECEALSYVREKMGLKNVDLMVSDALRKLSIISFLNTTLC